MFNPKEEALLKDLEDSEKLCVEKYRKYGEQASAGGLKNLFSAIEKQESAHLETIRGLRAGRAPTLSGGSSIPEPGQADYGENAQGRTDDQYLCSDALATEKHVSSVYDTSIFEFCTPPVRNALNHIQKEEQEHGQHLWSYLNANGMYS